MLDPAKSQMRAFLAMGQSSPVMFINCQRYYPEVRYPGGFSDKGYKEIVVHRKAGLEVAQTMVLSPQDFLINTLA